LLVLVPDDVGDFLFIAAILITIYYIFGLHGIRVLLEKSTAKGFAALQLARIRHRISRHADLEASQIRSTRAEWPERLWPYHGPIHRKPNAALLRTYSMCKESKESILPCAPGLQATLVLASGAMYGGLLHT
jgi:hypothetical protein